MMIFRLTILDTVPKNINFMKQEFSQKDFIYYCELVTKNAKRNS